MGIQAFAGCNGLTNIVIPSNITLIGSNAFCECKSLTSIEVDEENTAYKDIDGNLYSKDGSVLIHYAIGKTATEFTIPYGVTSIRFNAFSYCENLTSVAIADSVASMGGYVFSNCRNLKNILLIAKTPASISSDTFNAISKDVKFYCHSSALQNYQTATNWNVYVDNFIVDDLRLYFTMNSSAQKNYFLPKAELKDNLTGYATEQFVEQKIAEAEFGGGSAIETLNIGDITINGEEAIDEISAPTLTLMAKDGDSTDLPTINLSDDGYINIHAPNVDMNSTNMMRIDGQTTYIYGGYATSYLTLDESMAHLDAEAIKISARGSVYLEGSEGQGIELALIDDESGEIDTKLSLSSTTSLNAENIMINARTSLSLESSESEGINLALINEDGVKETKLAVNSEGTTITGRCQANSFYATSDARKKENIVDYILENSILDLPVKEFNFIGQDEKQIGCIAQDLQQLFPNLVKEDEEGYLSIQENKLVYLLLLEVKTLKEEINKLKGV
jgi:hypothetical protein